MCGCGGGDDSRAGIRICGACACGVHDRLWLVGGQAMKAFLAVALARMGFVLFGIAFWLWGGSSIRLGYRLAAKHALVGARAELEGRG